MRVLIVDDEPEICQRLQWELRKEGREVEYATSAIGVLERLKNAEQEGRAYALLLLDLRMPKVDGLSLLREIREARLDLDVVVITGYGDEDKALESIRLGAVDYLPKPISLEALRTAVFRVQQKRAAEEKRALEYSVLVVDDEKELGELIKRELDKEGYRTAVAYDGVEGLDHFSHNWVDVAIVDIKMPRMSGLEMLEKCREITDDFISIIITSYGDEERAIQALQLGVFNYLRKPVSLEELVTSVSKGIGVLNLRRGLAARTRELEIETALKGQYAQNLERMVAERTKEIKKLSDAVKASTESIVIADLEGKITDVNEATLKMYGTGNKEDLVGKSSFDLIAPEDREKAVAGMEEVMEKGYVKDREYHVITKDGSKLPVEMSVSIMKGMDGEPIGFVGVTTDITERKRAEQTLIKSKEFIQTVLNSMNDAISVIDVHDFKIIDVNSVFLDSYGLNKEDVIVKTCYEITHERAEPCAPPDDICPLLETKSTGEYSIFEHVHYTKDGEKRYLEVSTSPIKDENGKVVNVIHITRDITDRRRSEEEIKQRAARLAAINRISAAVSSTLDLNEIFGAITQQMVELFAVEHSGILMFDKEKEWGYILAEYPDRDVTAERFKVKGYLAAERIIADQKPLMIEDTLKDPLMAKVRDTMRRLGVKSMLIVPLVVRGETIGSIGLDAIKERRVFGQEEIELAQTIANQVSTAIENARLFAEIREHAELMDRLQPLSQALNTTRTLAEALETIGRGAMTLAGADRGAIYLRQPDDTVTCPWAVGLSPDYVAQVTSRVQEIPGGQLLERTEPVLISDLQDLSEDVLIRCLAEAEGYRALGLWPLVYEGRVMAAVGCYHDQPHRYTPAEVDVLLAFGRQGAVALENARLYEAKERHTARLKAIGEVERQIAAILDPDDLLRQVVAILVERFGYYYANILLVDAPAGEIVLRASAGQTGRAFEGYRLKIGQQGITGWVAGAGQPLLVNDITQEPRYHFVEELKDTRSELAVPIVVRGQVIGVMDVQSAKKDAFDEEDLFTLQTLAEQITVGLENARLFEETQRRLRELSALFEVSSALRGAATVGEMLPIILDKTLEVVAAKAGIIFLVDETGSKMKVPVARGPMAEVLVGRSFPLPSSVTERMLRTGESDISSDLAVNARMPAEMRAMLKGGESGIGLPLRAGGVPMGMMAISWLEPHTVADEELRLLTAIADMAASAIRRAGLFEQLEHRLHELATLFDVGKMVTATLRIQDVLDFIVGAASETLHAEASWLLLWDEQEERLVMRAAQGLPPELVGQVKYRLGEGLSGWAFLESKPVNVPAVAADPRWKPEPEHEASLSTGQVVSALVVPLVVGTKTLGVLGVANKAADGGPPSVVAFTPTDESLLTTLASQVAIAIENASLYEDVRDLAVATIRSLAAAIDARDPYTKGHSQQVAHLSVLLARQLGWGGADLEMLEFAALLHDVGKIGIPDAILRKIEPLTPEEWDSIRLHPYHSAQMVKPVEPLQRILPWIYHHQEWWDGAGYPDGLKGEHIPLGARIIAVADAFNAMTTERPYRKAKTREVAIAELRRCAGTQFDPQVAEAFVRLLEEEVDITAGGGRRHLAGGKRIFGGYQGAGSR
jgi:PAS domain S-box-containing protein